jgi:hypothetical protein
MAGEFKHDTRASRFSPPQGKGSKRRPENKEAFAENWDRIFGNKEGVKKLCSGCGLHECVCGR